MAPVKRDERRKELLLAIGLFVRQFSTSTVIFHGAIASRLGLNGTDHKAADLIGRLGPLTAGELADHMGLTTGAVTGVIDRLADAGFVRRGRDADDRRRVIIEPIPNPALERRMLGLFGSMKASFGKLMEGYSDRELAVILDFMQRVEAMTREETAKLRE